MEGYAIQIEGHASAVGSEARNQSLSRQRAAAVAAVLSQSGIPSTQMNVPAAMGVSDQVASNSTRQGPVPSYWDLGLGIWALGFGIWDLLSPPATRSTRSHARAGLSGQANRWRGPVDASAPPRRT